MSHFIEVRNLNKKYSDGFALHNINFKIEKGEILTLMGPSGSGKTSLLRNICGLDTPDSGSVHVNGMDVTSIPVQKRRIGLIFQDLALFPHMSVYDNVAYGLRSSGISEKEVETRVTDVTEMLRIRHLLERFPSQISGGERQRVALARSVVPDPLVLLLDEPMSSLDVPLRSTVRAEIKSFARKRGLTMIYVTHDHHEGFYMADRAGIIMDGMLDTVESPDNLFLNPSTAEIASFLGYNIILLNGSKYGVYPRDFEIVRDSPDISATVTSTGYEGDMFRISLVTGDGVTIQVLLEPDLMSEEYSTGTRLFLRIKRKVQL